MADVNFFDAFGYKWALVGPAENLQDEQYKVGWGFIGPVPPSVEQFNRVHQVADEKANYLFGLLNSVTNAAGIPLTAVSVTTLRDALRGTGLFQTAVAGTNDTKVATTAFVQDAITSNRGVRTMQVLTAGGGIFTVPAGITRVKYRMWGGGGGGGGAAAAANSAASGGGGGGYCEGIATVVPGAAISYTVGAGGTGGVGGGAPASGTAGGTSSFGGIATAGGGGAGLAANGAVQVSVGSGGAASGAPFNAAGAPGSSAYAISGGFILAFGGAAFGSPPGGPVSAGALANGSTPFFVGTGGGGGYLGGSGAAGSNGQLILEY